MAMLRHFIQVCLLLTLLASFVPAAVAQRHAYQFGKLVEATGKVVDDAIIVVERGRIANILTDPMAIPEGTPLTNLSSLTVIPGLIDAHVHMTYYWDEAPGTKPWEQLRERPAVMTLQLSQRNARRALQNGITMVRDLHADGGLGRQIRGLAQSGAILGPYFQSAGCGIFRTDDTTQCGGHSGGADIQRAVEEQLSGGADWIKIFASTGSADDLSGEPTTTFDELKSAIDLAHQHQRKVAVHSYGPEAARNAVLAGADSIEHAVDLDDETLSEMVRRRIVYVPTIDHNRYYADHASEFGYDDAKVEELRSFVLRNLETVRRAHRAGVRIVMGSDAVFTMFGENTRELGWFVEAGMTPMEALATATVNAAQFLGAAHLVGRLSPGYFATFVAVKGDPTEDINAVIDGVKWVMKDGRVVFDITSRNQDD